MADERNLVDEEDAVKENSTKNRREKKKREKKEKKEKKNAKGNAPEPGEDEDEKGGGRLILVLTTILIIAIWMGIIGILIKTDVGGFGSTVLYPLLKDVPYVNKILPQPEETVEQTEGTGVSIYTHGEMLPAHAYPELKKYPQLKGNFGTAWQNQKKEFDGVPAAFLFTTNCLMPPKESYADNVFTTEVVAFPGCTHIGPDKDFGPVIQKALELGGYDHDHSMSGINGGHMLTTGFGHAAVLSHAEAIIDAVKSGAVKHIFLVGGCDGAHPGRNYYTEFVKQTPMDSLVLTLACGKYRFNDLDLGEIGGLPRILDMGQCNDAYSAVTVALALADAFGCTVNDLPLTLVLSWYEQKAVCILLSLLALGVKNMYLGPTLPAFLSESVVNILVDTYGLQPITAPEQDLDAILHRG